jgi:uncharacterized protein YjiS (DUF1127 family)
MSVSTHHPLTNCQPAARAPFSFAAIAGWLDRTIHTWQERAADRRALSWMDERDLRDARLSRWQIERELARPFWRD